MKLVTKPKLPKWLMSSFPFKEEEETLSGLIVPFVLFSFMGLGVMWHEVEFSSAFLGTIITILIFVSIIAIIWWLMIQIDVLRVLRLRLNQHYKITEDEDDRLKTKKRLLDLCVKV
jgi:hypothetical protein